MCYHPKCREWHAPDHQAWATVGQTSLLKAERARQNRAYVRKLLQERQPEFAAALAAAKEQRSAPDVTAGHKPDPFWGDAPALFAFTQGLAKNQYRPELFTATPATCSLAGTSPPSPFRSRTSRSAAPTSPRGPGSACTGTVPGGR
jgi:hypothetical protein